MSKTSNNSQEFIELLEKIIDARFIYLKEINLENRRYASVFKEKEYDPLVKKMLDFLEEKSKI